MPKRKGGVMELENIIAAARGIKPTAQRNANEKIKRSRIIGYDRLQYGLTFKEVFYFVASIMALGMVMHFYSSI